MPGGAPEHGWRAPLFSSHTLDPLPFSPHAPLPRGHGGECRVHHFPQDRVGPFPPQPPARGQSCCGPFCSCCHCTGSAPAALWAGGLSRAQGQELRLQSLSHLLVQCWLSCAVVCGSALAGRAPSSTVVGMEPCTRVGVGCKQPQESPSSLGEAPVAPQAPLSLSHSHVAATLTCAAGLPVCDGSSRGARRSSGRCFHAEHPCQV